MELAFLSCQGIFCHNHLKITYKNHDYLPSYHVWKWNELFPDGLYGQDRLWDVNDAELKTFLDEKAEENKLSFHKWLAAKGHPIDKVGNKTDFRKIWRNQYNFYLR